LSEIPFVVYIRHLPSGSTGLVRLLRAFYLRNSTVVARDLLGKLLVRSAGGRRLSGTIVEVEAYRGMRDPASHAYRGRTSRNEVMFGEPGHAYVYFTYGNHYCLNVTCEPPGSPAAVLIRAIEPREGVETMRANRGVTGLLDLASGPGKLTKALGIGRDLNGEDLVSSERLFLEEGERPHAVATSARVGISKGSGFQWRYFAEGSPFVSRGKPSAPRPQNP
jgi:DNA-3-methyladenine glycosylase